MSIFRDHAFGYNETDKMRELRQRASANLTQLYRNRDKLKPDKPKKQTELERSSADEIQRGFIVLESRRLRKELGKLLCREKLEGPELEYAEDLQDQLDDYDAELEPYNRDELRRFVRLWNKSRKVKYRLGDQHERR